MSEFKKQLEKGAIKEAYRGLMDLKTHFKNKYPDYFISGSIYYGYMDMTYFSFIPQSLKRRNLKIAIVFNYDVFRFEVWLGGFNKQIQTEYWKLFKEKGWNKYHLVTPGKGVDSILEYILVDYPDFSNLDVLTKQIENGAMKFINDVESFLYKHEK
jgi:hypothetical protein